MIRRTFIALTATVAMAGGAWAQDSGENDNNGLDIVTTLNELGTFTTLLAAAEEAGLVPMLSGEGPHTLFAPTDAAFAALPEGTLENLLDEANEDQLVALLSHHVVHGEIMSVDLLDGGELTAADEDMLMVGSVNNMKTIGGANVVEADIDAENGVIHVIDAVLLP